MTQNHFTLLLKNYEERLRQKTKKNGGDSSLSLATTPFEEWNRLETDIQQTLAELSALKNNWPAREWAAPKAEKLIAPPFKTPLVAQKREGGSLLDFLGRLFG